MKLVEHKRKLVQCGWVNAPVETSEYTHFHLIDFLWIGVTIDDFAQGLLAYFVKIVHLARCGVELDSKEESGGGQGLVRVIVERIGVDRSVVINVVYCHSDDLSIKVKVVNEFIIPGLQMKRLDRVFANDQIVSCEECVPYQLQILRRKRRGEVPLSFPLRC